MSSLIVRRSFLRGLGSAFAAPAIVRASSLMRVRAYRNLPPMREIAEMLSQANEILADLAWLDLNVAMRRYATVTGFPQEWLVDA